MTADGLAADVPVPAATGERMPSLEVATILDLCDQILVEIGRRSHCFAWLRAPEAGAEEWLAVDAYYPANRLVVICRSGPGARDRLAAELVPAHGLRLLALDLASLGRDRADAEAFLRRSLSAIGPPPEQPHEPPMPWAIAALQPSARATGRTGTREAGAVGGSGGAGRRRGDLAGRPARGVSGGAGPLPSGPVDPEPGEEVFFHGHPSWLSMLDFYVKGLLAAVVAGVITGLVTSLASNGVQAGWVVAAVLVVYVVVLLAGFIRRVSTTYTITNQRLTIDVGILSRDLHQTRLERVQNVNSSQTLFQRMLGIGTVDFDTAGEAGFDFSFRGVAHPHRIVRTVDRAIHEAGAQRPGGV
jgi:membrane protein YdbS with pleckstrin-like domain